MAECKDSITNNTNAQKQCLKLEESDLKEEFKTDRVMEPLMLEDLKGNTIPKTFQRMQDTLNENCVLLNKCDYIFLFIHILMLETGFVSTNCKEYFGERDFGFHLKRILDCVIRLPGNWRRSKTVHSVAYVFPPFVQYTCKVTCMEVSEDIVVNASIDGIESDSYSVLIDPALYVITSTTNITNKFQSISHLSRLFKTSISSPIRNLIMRHNSLPAYCLEDLPIEILLNIMRYFDPGMLAQFESTCKTFRELSNDKTLWKKIRGGKWESFQYYKRNENARNKLTRFIQSRRVYRGRIE